MTTITSYLSLDMTNLDFYRVTQGSYASYLYTNYTYNGVSYPSLVEVDWQNGGYYYASIFAGSGILLDANKNIIAGSVTGYVESVWNGSAWLPLWSIKDFSTSASALYQAFLTPNTADDYATIGSVLSGNDVISSTGTGNETLAGFGGNDILDGGAGNDIMISGLGNDIYIVDSATDTVTEALNAGIDEVRTSLASYTLAAVANVENLTGTAAGAQALTGNGLANIITGNSGSDFIDGGTGADTMVGGLGNDAYVVDNIGDVVTEGANAGSDTVYASANYRLGANVEYLVLQGSAVQGYGNSLSNVINGTSADNLLDGDAGADAIYGGAGNDSYFLDNISDLVIENPNEGSDTVYASANYRLGANVEYLVLQGSAVQGYGNSLSNVIYGTSADNLLDGDTGADSMYGGAGNDTYFVDNIADAAIENANQGNDTVYATVDFRLAGNLENLILQGSANLQGYGDGGVNAIFGNTGNNLLDGGGGADTITGGAGNDTFMFVVGQAAGDTITDFAGNGSGVGDSLVFSGYGTTGQGATFTQIGATNQWQIHSGLDGHNEIISFSNGASINASDYLFL